MVLLCLAGSLFGAIDRLAFLDRFDDGYFSEIRWLAYELNPDMPESGEEQTAHLARK